MRLLTFILLFFTIVSYGQISEPFDNFDGPGLWTSPGGNTGSHNGELCYNITGTYQTNTWFVFESPVYDLSSYGQVDLLWYQECSVRSGDEFRLYIFDGTWTYYDITNLSGLYQITIPNTVSRITFDLLTYGNGGVKNKYAHVAFFDILNPQPLPVEMLEFTASLQDEGTMVKWSTASENNSQKFDLYKSLDGTTWGLLDEIPAGGFSNSELTYKYFDTRIESGYSYYKLIQIDIDGEEDTYGPVYVYRNVFTDPRKYNLMGQEVNQFYKGLIIDEDGRIKYND